MTFEAINLFSEKSSQQHSRMETLANGNISWLVANCTQYVAAVDSICIQPERWEMTWMTEYQMDSDELQRLNTSCAFKTIESGIRGACKHIPLGILSLKQIQFYICFFVADGSSILFYSLGFLSPILLNFSVSVYLLLVLFFFLMYFRCAHHQNIFNNKIMTVSAFKSYRKLCQSVLEIKFQEEVDIWGK